MIELNKKIFGKITIKEIIGAEPPEFPDTQNLLEKEFQYLISQLESETKDNLKKFLDEQLIAEKQVNNRPGAMALAQNKIQMFVKYNQKYIQVINEKLKS